MARPAEQIVCSDCGATFAFSAAEAEFYASRGLAPPKRCPACRAARKASGRGRDERASGRPSAAGPREGGSGGMASAPNAGARRGARAWSRPRYTGDVNEYRSPMQVPQRDTEYRAPAFRDDRTSQRPGGRDAGGTARRPPARDARDPGRAASRATFRVVCSACGAEAEVPFEPEPGREVFCQACYRRRGSSR